MEAWHQTAITDTPPVLLVDGVWVQVLVPTGETWTDQSGHQRQHVRGVERVVLAVMGMWPDGRRQILDYQAAPAEDTASWQQLFSALVARGLSPRSVQLVVSDGGTGLPGAITSHFPQARQQRCVVHKVRGLERALVYHQLEHNLSEQAERLSPEQARSERRQRVSADAHAIFEAPSRDEAYLRWQTFQSVWGSLEPEVVRRLGLEFDLCLNFYDFAPSLHAHRRDWLVPQSSLLSHPLSLDCRACPRQTWPRCPGENLMTLPSFALNSPSNSSWPIARIRPSTRAAWAGKPLRNRYYNLCHKDAFYAIDGARIFADRRGFGTSIADAGRAAIGW